MNNFVIRSKFHFKVAMFLKLPSVFFWGVKLSEVKNNRAVVLLPYNWRTKNPFKSIYFSAQAGAAELSTGLLILEILADRNDISMLVTAAKLDFHKKATTTIKFVCSDGEALKAVIEELNEEGDTKTVILKSVGYDNQDDIVSEMEIEWSLKKRNK